MVKLYESHLTHILPKLGLSSILLIYPSIGNHMATFPVSSGNCCTTTMIYIVHFRHLYNVLDLVELTSLLCMVYMFIISSLFRKILCSVLINMQGWTHQVRDHHSKF